jgi:replicative DNA helicase|tara:strand:- start:1142 stop:2530 length:1389 start_codon:yes stop_codon:yes gene_type:complete
MKLETTILSQLVYNEDYCRKVIPFLVPEYFSDDTERYLYKTIQKHLDDYNTLPTLEILGITINQTVWEDGEQLYDDVINYLDNLNESKIDNEWLIDNTEKFCQEKSVYNAVMDSIQILDGKDKENSKGAIPEILSKALSVSFDNHIGHDWVEDFSERYDFYHKTETRVPFDLEYMNLITKGGLPQKTLSCILAGTGVGKSLAMCHFAASNLMDSKKVLYITLEMAEERIAERIDANLLDVSLKELEDLPKTAYIRKVERIRDKTEGKLIIKEYPTATAGTGHFRHLLNELRLKRNFVPDIVYIDYLNICSSMRLRYGANVNSYTYIKAIAEEMRGLAVEKGIPIVTATQTTRSGFSNSDPGLEDTSESFGLPATVDLMIALVSSDELEGLNQIMVKQLKNRFNDPVANKRFVVGVDRAKMRLYDVENSAQEGLIDDTPLMDNTEFGQRNEEAKSKRNFGKLS